MSIQEDCRPSLRGEMKKARHSGYDLTSSLFEFIDNARDTGCEEIRMDLREKIEGSSGGTGNGGIKGRKIFKIIISDNFSEGIPLSVLRTMFSWTYDRQRSSDQIGEYGTGFKSASVNLGNRLCVYTLDASTGVYYRAIADWEEMEEMNVWDPTVEEIDMEKYRIYHPWEVGTSFVMESLRHEFFYHPRNHPCIAQTLYENMAYHYKYFLEAFPEKKMTVRGIFENGEPVTMKTLSCEEGLENCSFFRKALHIVESRVLVYLDQAGFFNYFVQRAPSSSTGGKIEMVENVGTRKNGNAILKPVEVSIRILANMRLIGEVEFRSCVYFAPVSMETTTTTEAEEPPPTSLGTIDVILNDRVVGRDLTLRKKRTDGLMDYVKHEVRILSKELSSILGIQYNKKSHFADNELKYTLEHVQGVHEKMIVRQYNMTVNTTDHGSATLDSMGNNTVMGATTKEDEFLSMIPHIETLSSVPSTPLPATPPPPPPPPSLSLSLPSSSLTPEPEPALPSITVPQDGSNGGRRKNFTTQAKISILTAQECRDSEMDFLLKQDILPFDYDHISDRTNNSEDNGQALSVILHAIKSRRPIAYEKILKNRTEYIVDLLNCITSSKIFREAYQEGKIVVKPPPEKCSSSIEIMKGIFFSG